MIDSNDRPTETKTRTTQEEQIGRNDPNQSASVGTVPESRETSEQGAIRSNRTVGEGFFAGGGTIDEAILMQLYEVAEKGHQNALACIEWYQNERLEFEKQKQKLQELLEVVKQKRQTEPNSAEFKPQEEE